VVNLFSAIKFSQAQSTVTVSIQDLGDRVLFELKDQGRGIPANQLENIFGRFQQVNASDSRQKGELVWVWLSVACAAARRQNLGSKCSGSFDFRVKQFLIQNRF
jgi:K+-sensing histidine kinase KdpD